MNKDNRQQTTIHKTQYRKLKSNMNPTKKLGVNSDAQEG
jgi:hypothetical protein